MKFVANRVGAHDPPQLGEQADGLMPLIKINACDDAWFFMLVF
jgi:hypothetical protein